MSTLLAHAGFRRGPHRVAYNEAAFRHFLGIDRARAQRSQRSLYLVLVAIRQGAGRRAQLNEAVSAAVFRGLLVCIREIDFVGWYQERSVAGAVLAQSGPQSGDGRSSILHRMIPALRRELPQPHADQLRVSVIRLGASPERRS